jgi:hypothetical protein
VQKENLHTVVPVSEVSIVKKTFCETRTSKLSESRNIESYGEDLSTKNIELDSSLEFKLSFSLDYMSGG